METKVINSPETRKQSVQIFNYNGNPITFNNGDDVMVNATQMAKPFGKLTKDWLANNNTSEFLDSLSAVRGIPLTDLVNVIRGGNPRMQGTWLHQDAALEFARWLSPAFAIWTNDRIKELLTTGVATVSNDDEMIANAILILQKRLDAHKQRVQILEGQTQLQQEKIKELTPKAEYTNEVLQSTNTYTMTEMAKELGFRSVAQFTYKLKEAKIMFRQSDRWMLTAKYAENGYTKVRTFSWLKQDESIGTNSITVWTEKGRWFLHQILKGGAE